MKRLFRVVAATTALAFASSCAVILHPERKGNNSTPLDTVPLVVDILLFLPGLVPGIVALVLDFGTGAIYLQKSGGSKPFLGDNDGERDKAQSLQVQVVDDKGAILEMRELTVLPPATPGEPIALALPDLSATQWADRKVQLRIVGSAGEPIVLDAM